MSASGPRLSGVARLTERRPFGGIVKRFIADERGPVDLEAPTTTYSEWVVAKTAHPHPPASRSFRFKVSQTLILRNHSMILTLIRWPMSAQN
ncbi:MAG: hypothetical protein KTR24_01445 [Saprospiraceae bacterium]|nr:hypothetical protein [Saprospiraceae bacterium]